MGCDHLASEDANFTIVKKGNGMSIQDSQKPFLMKYLIYYGLLYLISYLLITSLSSMFKVFFGYATIPLLVAVFTAIQFIRNNKRAMNKSEKVKFILTAFTFTVVINVLFTANVIGDLRSIDELDGDFILRQIMQLIALWGAFGSDKFYNYVKNNYT